VLWLATGGERVSRGVGRDYSHVSAAPGFTQKHRTSSSQALQVRSQLIVFIKELKLFLRGRNEVVLKVSIPIILPIVLLCGCKVDRSPDAVQSDVPGEAAGHIPANYRIVIRDSAKRIFSDPYSIRDATISVPFNWPDGVGNNRWFVCVGLNAKNKFGAYTGYERFLIQFKDEKATWDKPGQGLLGAVCEIDWPPFPELNGKG
jgi:hypothetical protein